MRMSRTVALLAFVVSLSPVAARAADPAAPHDKSFTDGDCDNCHRLAAVTSSGALDYSDGCISCHNQQTGSPRRFPSVAEQAKPGVSGSHHNWSGYAENSAYGAVTPSATAHQRRLVDGKLQCATCHNIHTDADPSLNPNSQHTKVSLVPGSPGGSTLTLSTPGTKPRGYRVKIQTKDSATTGTFIYTREGYVATPTWFNWDSAGSRWIAGTATGPGRPYTAGVAQAIEDTADLRVTWAVSSASPGNQWDILVSYPGMRFAIVNDVACTYCHPVMNQKTARVANRDPAYQVDGIRTFSHPVGEALNSNGLETDQAEILAADGKPQSASADANVTNRLRLDAGVVRCTTCHTVHGADSNSLTDDTAQ